MEGIPERIDSKFRYVLLAAHRAEQLIRGAQPKLARPDKHTTTAMAEVSQDLIVWDYGQLEPAADDSAEAAADEA
ncbi:MAG: DNA-directed RNA polymerase subunit omega [Acidobacteriota bacterium]